MINRLIVKNFAIIEDLTVDFKSGMTVLTGETGAGKSLIIDSISLLLGARADSDMIRYGETKAIVEGIFTHTDLVNDLFKTVGVAIKDEIDIYREIGESSRNVIKVNGTNVTLTFLKQISVMLADVHIQNDTFKLFNPDEYLNFLDPKEDKKFDNLLAKYSKALYDYNNAYASYDKIKKNQKNSLDKLDFLKYEKEEIEGLNLYEGIDDELSETIARLSNFDKISNALNSAYQSLDSEVSAIDMIYDAAKSLESVSEYDAEISDMSSKLMDTYYISDEIKGNISKIINSLDYDENELNTSVEILNDINKAKEKYKKSVPELIKYLEDITLEIDMAENYDEVLSDAKKKVEESFTKLVGASTALSEYRYKLAKSLEKGIISECKDLDLDNTTFECSFNRVEYNDPFSKSIFTENGVDTVDFLVSFNKGEPVRPLSKVASGGEASRMMLAFKSYFSKSSGVGLQVFDEIDTGVSGSTALKIANKMRVISENIQVLCITHLPQVAAYGNQHIHIYKVMEGNRTKTEIVNLDGEKRVEEIARMLSGDKISVFALEHAKELLER